MTIGFGAVASGEDAAKGRDLAVSRALRGSETASPPGNTHSL